MSLEITLRALRLAQTPLLKNLNLRVPGGVIHTVMGASGSGKSSLLAAICGTLSAPLVFEGDIRLNGQRIYLKSTHTCNHFPIGLQFSRDPDMLRRDMLNLKVMGFNMVRFIWGAATPMQLDLCDEIGLMVYEESYAAWPIAPSPKMPERFDAAVSELILRDRNHPSVVTWGLLNETKD